MQNIIIEKTWQYVSEDFFQLKIECNNEHAVVNSIIYADCKKISELANSLETFRGKENEEYSWEINYYEERNAKPLIVKIKSKDNFGHIKIEISMVLGDEATNGNYQYYCTMLIETELGLLNRFGSKMKIFLSPQFGANISLIGE